MSMNHDLDPSGPPTFPKFIRIVLDDLPPVQKDIEDLTKTYLVGKILGDSIDLRTIYYSKN